MQVTPPGSTGRLRPCALPRLISAECPAGQHVSSDGLPRRCRSTGKDLIIRCVKCHVGYHTHYSQCSWGPLPCKPVAICNCALGVFLDVTSVEPLFHTCITAAPHPGVEPPARPRSRWARGPAQTAAVQVPAMGAASHGDNTVCGGQGQRGARVKVEGGSKSPSLEEGTWLIVMTLNDSAASQ